ncbi:PRD domain-containing protein [Merdibacter massiliensis]|uniref:PRD domain-containing protein n=1 Tax=Merdibacter massiliensis TaxID=1871030 RepID=UPI00096A3F65|nr:PRD domain-containing protein [Merdibacter massiliensis]
MKKIEEDVLKYIKNKTKMITNSRELDNFGIDAEEISILFKKDRANVSRIMNDLWKRNYLVKIFGRPVFYLDYGVLRRAFPNADIPSFIKKGEKISKYLIVEDSNENDIKKNLLLDELIGENGSLSKQIEKAKAAISYPPHGLHTIICGSTGTEKAEIAYGMVEYAKNIHGCAFQFHIIDCKRYSELDMLEKLLFGDEQTKGVLDRLRIHFLIFENVESMSSQCIQLLSGILEKNAYFKQNKKNDLKCMFIITTELQFQEYPISIISKYCPVKIELNDIDQRGAYEKMEIIMHLFALEATNINKKIRISKDVLYILLKTQHKLNIIDLKNQIKLICSDAYLQQNKTQMEIVTIHLHNLPQEMLQMKSSSFIKLNDSGRILNMIQEEYITFDETGHSKEYIFFKEFPKKSATHLLSQFINEFNFDLNNLSSIENYASENITCLKNLNKLQLISLKKNIDPLIYQIVMTILYKYSIFNKLREHEELLYGILLHITNGIHRKDLSENNMVNINDLQQIYPTEYKATIEIFDEIYHYFHVKRDRREIIFLINYLVIANQWANQTKVAILVIAHGDSVATQMVKYIKENIQGEYYLDSIDFNEQLQLNDCLELACVKSIELNKGAGILVVSDKEPLNSIGDYITSQTNIPTRSINNLSLNLLILLVEKTMTSICDLSALIDSNEKQENQEILNNSDRFIKKITKRVIAKTLTFLDANKAVDTLMQCLELILQKINVPYSDEIATKYLCHCSNMIERVIKNETWENSRANKYVRLHTDLIQIIDDSMKLVNNSFGIKIPKNELVYISEIFSSYIEE